MRIYKQEAELRAIAERLSDTITVETDNGEVTRKPTKRQHNILYGLLYGALLGLNWGESTRSNPQMEEAILNATEFQGLVMMPTVLKDGERLQSYLSLYLPLKGVLREWEQAARGGSDERQGRGKSRPEFFLRDGSKMCDLLALVCEGKEQRAAPWQQLRKRRRAEQNRKKRKENTAMFNYTFKTTFWLDFSIADRFGKVAIKDTYRRAFSEWKTNVEYFTELVMVLNHKIWQHYEAGREQLARLYDELWREANSFGLENFKGKDLEYFWQTLD